MSILILLAVVATALSIVTIRTVLHDGRGPTAPPTSRFTDPQLLPPGAQEHLVR